MVQKPKIQYVGQFYVHGSEARKLELQQEKKKAKTSLPAVRPWWALWLLWSCWWSW